MVPPFWSHSHALAILNDIFKNKTQTFAMTLKTYAKYVPMDIVGGVHEIIGLACPCYPSNSVFLLFPLYIVKSQVMYVMVLGYWKSGRTSTLNSRFHDSALKPRSQARFNALSHIFEKLLEKISKNPRWSRYVFTI